MVDNESLSVIINLSIGVGVFISILLVYDLLRYFFPGLFFYREQAARDPSNQRYDGTPFIALPRPSPYPLSWVRSTLCYPEHLLIKTHGLDVTLYLRFLLTQVKLFAVLTVYTAIVLYPTYITAENRERFPEDDPLRPVGVEIISLANVADQSHRLWVTLASELFVVFTILYFLYIDIRTYTCYRRAYRSNPRNPANYAVIIVDIPVRYRDEKMICEIFEKLFPSQIKRVHLARNADTLLKLKEKYVKAIIMHERAELKAAKHASPTTTHASDTEQSANDPTTTDDDDIALWQKRQEDIRNELAEKEAELDDVAPFTNAAIIVFHTKRAATFAATAPVWASYHQFIISRAPEPRAVNWARLHITYYAKRVRESTTFVCLTGLAFLWTFPAGFIQALGNLDEFAKQWPDSFLANFKERYPEFASFVSGVVPPLLLFLVLLLAPVVVRFVVGFERTYSLILREAKVRNFLYFFYFMSNFVYAVVIGSVFSKFKAVLDNPTEIVSLLSTSVPGQATFLMKYVLINAFLGSALGMLNIGRLIVRPFLMARAKTSREKRKADRAVAHYRFARTYALYAMVALISYVYCTIAPLICAVAFVYFTIAYLCRKQLLLYSHRGHYDGGGFLFKDAWTCLLVGLYTHQLSMIGIFTLKLATTQAILAILSFLFSICFTLYCRVTFLLSAKHGSLMDQATADEEAGLRDEIPEGFSELYTHPGMRTIEEFDKFEEMDISGDQKRESLTRSTTSS